MTGYLPKIAAGEPFTLATSADVTGGRLVAVSGSQTVAHAADDSAVIAGVAGFDALSGELVTIYPLRGSVQRLVASAAIAAGARVVAEDLGKIQTIAAKTNPIGIALEAAAADGDVIDVLCN
jgi:hypothetical protein